MTSSLLFCCCLISARVPEKDRLFLRTVISAIRLAVKCGKLTVVISMTEQLQQVSRRGPLMRILARTSQFSEFQDVRNDAIQVVRKGKNLAKRRLEGKEEPE